MNVTKQTILDTDSAGVSWINSNLIDLTKKIKNTKADHDTTQEDFWFAVLNFGETGLLLAQNISTLGSIQNYSEKLFLVHLIY